ncbi:MAG TPA: HAD family phosphatase [Flavitalea sp.]|nr:HAD family phosphatase [Flavitalea sp.]
MKFETVIFDLGGVLIDWNPDYMYRTIFNDESKMREFYNEVCTSEWNEEQDAGRGLKEATEELVARFPHEENNIRAYYGRWEEMLKGEIEGTVNILDRIRKKNNIKLYALTNWSAETFPVALRRFPFLQWFHGRLVSGEERMRKPFPEIYELLTHKFGINPSSAVYIDDNERNLKVPREMGIYSILFESPSQLEEELRNLQIL